MTRQRPSRLSVTRLEDRLTPATTNSPFIASGSGAGSRPLVQLYRADGSIRSQFMAYDAAFTGGVSVAMADVNNDGVMDIITAAGAGGGPHVKVFDGRSLASLLDPTRPHPALVIEPTALFSFYAYDSRFTGGVSVASGDVDGDGYADIVTGAGAGGGPHVKAFSGKTGAEIRSFYAFDPAFTGGVIVAVGEVTMGLTTGGRRTNGPVFADILAGSGAGMKATVVGFNGKTGERFFTLNPHGDFAGGVYVATGNSGGDFDDVITGAGPGGGPHVTVYSGYTLGYPYPMPLPLGGLQPLRSFYAYDQNFTGGVRVAAGDVNGDGVADILTGAGPGGGPHVKAFDGLTNGNELFGRFKYGLSEGTPEFTAGVTIAAPFLPVQPRVVSDFTLGADGWTADFSDYTLPNDANSLGLDSGLRTLPASVGTGTGYLLQGTNTTGELFMFVQKKLGRANGVLANQVYIADFTVTFASNVPAGLAGAPAESMYLKVGGGSIEPTPAPVFPPQGTARMGLNVDAAGASGGKGTGGFGGIYASVIGNVANGQAATDPRQFTSVVRSGGHFDYFNNKVVRSDANSDLWLMVGIDSTYLGPTQLYLQSITVTLRP